MNIDNVGTASPWQINDWIDENIMIERVEAGEDFLDWSGDLTAAMQLLDKFPHWKIILNKNRVDNRVYVETDEGCNYFSKEMALPEAIARCVVYASMDKSILESNLGGINRENNRRD